eukprot:2838748-Lingulodinium_polyedra.AAC.1
MARGVRPVRGSCPGSQEPLSLTGQADARALFAVRLRLRWARFCQLRGFRSFRQRPSARPV